MASGEHYFTSDPGSAINLRTLSVQLAGSTYNLTTASGIFSPQRIDTGTRVLLEHTTAPPPGGDFLDLGCGWGPIALTLALEAPHATVWAVDVNERALELVRKNAADVGLLNVNAVLPDDVPDNVRFAAIWSNPPIRVGKEALHDLLLRWLPRLVPGGEAYLVVAKHLGADSLQRWLAQELGTDVDRVATDKGFRVLRVLGR